LENPTSASVALNGGRTLYFTVLAVFLASIALTYYFTSTMSGGMDMPGGWNMSMMWMVMPGQTWLAAALLFAAMWQGMMVAMMLPSALPMLLLYRRAATFRRDSSQEGASAGFATTMMGTGYFAVWLLFGILAYASGMTLGWAAMRWTAVSRVVPLASGAALVAAGIYQWTPWKNACLRHCRDPLSLVADHLDGGWARGLKLGFHHGAFCVGCCWALMVIQLVLGVMNVPVMVGVAVVIALEKLVPWGNQVAKGAGLAAVLGGLFMVTRAVFIA